MRPKAWQAESRSSTTTGTARPDIFFTNGANIATLKKDDPKYRNRLFRNNRDGTFTDVTDAAGLAGSGYDIGVAVADYNNDGCPDIFVAGVYRNTLYRNNCNGTFTDVTEKAGLADSNDPQYGPLWAEAAVWVDVNNDGLLDLFIVDYMQWKYGPQALCHMGDVADYCHPKYYKGQPNRLFLNNGDGTFRDVSKEWGIRDQVGKGMGVGMADYDLDGKQDLFVTNDAEYNFLFHNLGKKFEEVAFDAGVALPEGGQFISGMGLDFRDFNNDGYPDIAFVALQNQTFPLFLNTGKGDFREVTTPSGMRDLSMRMSGYGVAIYDFDNDGWKDLFVTPRARGVAAAAWHRNFPIQHRLSQSGSEREMGGADRRSRAGCRSEGTAPRLRAWRLRRRRPRGRGGDGAVRACGDLDEPERAYRSLAGYRTARASAAIGTASGPALKWSARRLARSTTT